MLAGLTGKLALMLKRSTNIDIMRGACMHVFFRTRTYAGAHTRACMHALKHTCTRKRIRAQVLVAFVCAAWAPGVVTAPVSSVLVVALAAPLLAAAQTGSVAAIGQPTAHQPAMERLGGMNVGLLVSALALAVAAAVVCVSSVSVSVSVSCVCVCAFVSVCVCGAHVCSWEQEYTTAHTRTYLSPQAFACSAGTSVPCRRHHPHAPALAHILSKAPLPRTHACTCNTRTRTRTRTRTNR